MYDKQNIFTGTGYLAPLPRSADEKQVRVAVMQDATEYRIIPCGADVDWTIISVRWARIRRGSGVFL